MAYSFVCVYSMFSVFQFFWCDFSYFHLFLWCNIFGSLCWKLSKLQDVRLRPTEMYSIRQNQRSWTALSASFLIRPYFRDMLMVTCNTCSCTCKCKYRDSERLDSITVLKWVCLASWCLKQLANRSRADFLARIRRAPKTARYHSMCTAKLRQK